MAGNRAMSQIQYQISQFVAAHDWEKYHNGERLASALAVEVGELQKLFLWGQQPHAADLRDELSDILIYVIQLANYYDIDLDDAIDNKMHTNSQRFPIGGDPQVWQPAP